MMNKMIQSVHNMEQKMLKDGTLIEVERMNFQTDGEKIAYAFMLGAKSIRDQLDRFGRVSEYNYNDE